MRCACISSSKAILSGLAVISVALAGCASEGEALEKRLAKLQEEVTRVQSQTDRMAERLDAVELRQATEARSEERVANAAPATVSRPKLKVVRVESDGDVPVDSTIESASADDGPRMVIQGEGKSLETRALPAPAKSAPKPEPKSESSKKSDSPKATPK